MASRRAGAPPVEAVLRLHLARHGETAAARDGWFCGVTECGLTAAGRRMAALLAERCAAEGRWRAVVSSPLERCVATARPAAERLGLPLELAPGLREIDHGAWEGRRAADLATSEAAALRAWEEHPGFRAAPGGETGYEVAARATPVIESLRSSFADGDVLVVSHKATIRVLACTLLGIDVDRYRARLACPPGSVTTFELRAGRDPRLLGLADVSHLPPALRGGDATEELAARPARGSP